MMAPLGEGRTTEPAHHAEPPLHLCQACGRAWPCPIAQCDLLAEFYGDPIGLGVYLATAFARAVRDRTERGAATDIERTYRRYLGWVGMARRPLRQ